MYKKVFLMLSYFILFLILYIDCFLCETFENKKEKISGFPVSKDNCIKDQEIEKDSSRNRILPVFFDCKSENTPNLLHSLKKIQSFQILTYEERKVLQDLYESKNTNEKFEKQKESGKLHRLTYGAVLSSSSISCKSLFLKVKPLGLGERLYLQGSQLKTRKNIGTLKNRDHLTGLIMAGTESKRRNDLQKVMRESISNAKLSSDQHKDNLDVQEKEITSDKKVLESELKDINSLKKKKLIESGSVDPIMEIIQQVKKEVGLLDTSKAEPQNLQIPIPPNYNNELESEKEATHQVENSEKIIKGRYLNQGQSKLTSVYVPELPDTSLGIEQELKNYKHGKGMLPPGAEIELEEFLSKKRNGQMEKVYMNGMEKNSKFSGKPIKGSRGIELTDETSTHIHPFQPLKTLNKGKLNKDIYLTKSGFLNNGLISEPDIFQEKLLSSLLSDLFPNSDSNQKLIPSYVTEPENEQNTPKKLKE